MPGPRIDEALGEARRRLAGIADTPRLEAELLLARALDKPRSHLHAWPERRLSNAQRTALEVLLDRRGRGEPLAYVLGRREFWSLELEVEPGVLIPRPDTETLVERALQLLPADADGRIADLGTGSGAIALAIAHERPRARVVATDRSPRALDIARRNAARLGLANVEFRRGDWCGALGGERFDLIVANPPYVAERDPHLVQGDLRFEPLEALVAGPEGMDDIQRIVACTPAHLTTAAHLVLEHGCDQGKAVRALLEASGFAEVRTYRDVGDRERVSEGTVG